MPPALQSQPEMITPTRIEIFDSLHSNVKPEIFDDSTWIFTYFTPSSAGLAELSGYGAKANSRTQ